MNLFKYSTTEVEIEYNLSDELLKIMDSRYIIANTVITQHKFRLLLALRY